MCYSYSLSLLVHLSHHTKSVQSVFLSKVYGTASVTVKRSFDDYIVSIHSQEYTGVS